MKKNAEYVGVEDEFIPEDEKYVDESLLGDKEESNRKIKKTAKSVIIVYIIFAVMMFAMAIGIIIFTISSFGKAGKKIMDDTEQKAITMQEDYDERFKEIQDKINKD